jgi:hypothetical protein
VGGVDVGDIWRRHSDLDVAGGTLDGLAGSAGIHLEGLFAVRAMERDIHSSFAL